MIATSSLLVSREISKLILLLIIIITKFFVITELLRQKLPPSRRILIRVVIFVVLVLVRFQTSVADVRPVVRFAGHVNGDCRIQIGGRQTQKYCY